MKKALSNLFKDVNPEGAAMWDFDKNPSDFNLDEIKASSEKMAFFKCQKNPKHQFKKRISKMTSSRTGLNVGCIYCSPNAKIPFPGETDLFSVVPEASKMWDFEKNTAINPLELLPKSAKKAHFKCKEGHSVFRKIADFTGSPKCPTCSKQATKIIYHHPYTPMFWNNDKNEGDFFQSETTISKKKAFFKCQKCLYEWNCTLATWHKHPFCLCCGFDGLPGSEIKNKVFVEESDITTLRQAFPEIGEYWDYEKNHDLSYNSITSGSAKRVWLKCSENHSFQRAVRYITSNKESGVSCPICTNRHSSVTSGINDLFSVCPEAEKQWDYTRNVALDPKKLPYSNRSIAAFVCKKRHQFDKRIIDFYLKPNCPTCEIFAKSIQVAMPEMLKFWDYSRMKFSPDEIVPSSKEIGHWRCKKCNYTWEQSFFSRSLAKKCKCPRCEQGHFSMNSQSFSTYNPGAAKCWHPTKNTYLTPETCSFKSDQKVWLICPNDNTHIYQKAVRSISMDTPYSCPFCTNGQGKRKPIIGVNDLFTKNPTAKEMWDWENNKSINPSKLFENSRDRVWFKCSEGHSFTRTVYLFNRSSNCPICRKEPIVLSNYPKILNQWNYSKNEEINVDETSIHSKISAWWICNKCSYEWEAQISSRSLSKGECPCCETKIVVVKGINDLFTTTPELKEQYDFNKNKSVDHSNLSANSSEIVWWHCNKCDFKWESSVATQTQNFEKSKQSNKDTCPGCLNKEALNDLLKKYSELESRFSANKNGVEIRKLGHSFSRSTKYWWKCFTCGETNHATTDQMLRALDSQSPGCSYCSGKKVRRENSFASLHPEIMDEYDPNNKIDPYNVTEKSGRNVNWICRNNNNHRWVTSFLKRTKGEGNCPLCRGYHYGILFSHTHPDFEKFFDKEKNDFEFENLRNKSNRIVWWMCDEGHSFERRPYNFECHKEFSCPVCLQQKIIIGLNSLKDTHPAIARTWSYKNSRTSLEVSSEWISPGIWKCPDCTGEYVAVIKRRCADDWECPYCTNRMILPGLNQIKDHNPSIMPEWSNTNSRDINEFPYTSTYLANWKCSTCCGEYVAPINKRVDGTYPCPYCTNRKALSGLNQIKDRNPSIVPEWSDTNSRNIEEFPYTSNYLADWKCPTCCGEYVAPINKRVDGTYLCPYCTNRKTLPGLNQIKDHNPVIVPEWSDTNLRDIDEFPYTSSYWANWKCQSCSGEYAAPINRRVDNTHSCPYCSNRRPLDNFNTIHKLKPALVAEWSSNNERSIDEFTIESWASVLWTCPDCSYDYEERIRNREHGDDSCPYCNNRIVISGFNSLLDIHPEVAAEWNFVYNSILCNPNEILPSSSIKVWWKCTENNDHNIILSPKEYLTFKKRKKNPCLECKGLRKKKRHFI